jgi:hypothetical protein
MNKTTMRLLTAAAMIFAGGFANLASADEPLPMCQPGDEAPACEPEPTCGYSGLPCCEPGSGPFGDGCLDGFTACTFHDDDQGFCEEA